MVGGVQVTKKMVGKEDDLEADLPLMDLGGDGGMEEELELRGFLWCQKASKIFFRWNMKERFHPPIFTDDLRSTIG